MSNCLRRLFLALILFSLSSLQSAAEQHSSFGKKILSIQSVEFEKADRNAFAKAMGLVVGGRLNKKKIDTGLRALHRQGKVDSLFIEVESSTRGVNVFLRGSRPQKIRNVIFKGIDQEVIEEAQQNVVIQSGQSTDMRALSELREQIELAYKRRGFYNPQVRLRLIPLSGSSLSDVEIMASANTPAIVSRVNLQGVPDKLLPAIRQQVEIRPGDRYTKVALDKSLDNLRDFLQANQYYTSRIESVDVRFDRGQTSAEVFILIDLGRRYHFIFKGNTVFEDYELRELFTEDLLASVNSKDRIARGVVEKYQAVGYHFCSVRLEEHFEKRESAQIVEIQIAEGPKVIIDEVHFSRRRPGFGTVRRLSESDLERMFFETAPGILARRRYWKKGMRRALRNFQDAITEQGYMKSRVSEPRAVFSKDKKGVELFFDVELGVRTRITGISFEGNRKITSRELLHEIPVGVGEPFSYKRLDTVKKKTIEIYGRRGFIDVELPGTTESQVQFSRDQESAVLRIRVQEGAQYRVGDITVEGNRKTREKVIKREMLLSKGDLYNPYLIRDSEEAISLLGLFSRVEVLSEPHPTEKYVKNLKIAVREIAPGAGEVGFGGTYEDPLFRLRAFGGVGYSNVFGLNQTTSIRGEVRLPVSGRQVFPFLEYFTTIGYLAPYVFDFPFTLLTQLSMDSFQISFDPDTSVSKLQTRARFEIKIERKFTKYITGIYRVYRLERTNTETFDANQNQIGPDEIELIGSTGPGVVVDFRNDQFNPTTGSYHLLDLEFAHPLLLSNANIAFVMLISRNSFYLPIAGPFSFTGFVGAGYAKSLFSNEPIPEARLANDLSVGGQSSIRGFGIRQFQPGNTATQTAFFNVRGELGVQFFDKLKGVVFLDSGQIYPELRAQRRHDGVGIGFRYATPVGPIAIDLAHGLGAEGKSIQFYFSIGSI